MALSDADQIRAALSRNGAEPAGLAKSARAEEIGAAAEALGDPGLLVSALHQLINAYEYGAEHAKLPVPFARLLRLLDEHPDSFSREQLHWTQWYFKWVTTRLIEIPDAPLAAISGWIREMERRYRVAGFSMRTIAAQDLLLSKHVGDEQGAETSRQTLLALARDQMSDCAACEAYLLGQAHLMAGRDRDALASWSDVLSGTLTCREEPHATLAASLLPLLRLGKAGDAKSNHLRGYHLVRGHANLGFAIGEHLEFCALTGNEGRGVEILAENWRLLTAVTDPLPRLNFLTGVAVLLRRLTATGYGSIPVHSGTVDGLLGPIVSEIAALAARFDARNGTAWVSEQMNQRMDRPPLLDQLALSGRPAAAPQAQRELARIERPDEPPDDLGGLVARARGLDKIGHPDARSAWDQVRALAAGAELDALLAGDLAEDRAFASVERGDLAAAVTGLRAASRHFETAGRPGRAGAASARAEWAAAQQDPDFDAWPGLDAQLARAQELLGADEAEPADLLTVRHARALVAAMRLERGADPDREQLSARLVTETEALIADAREHENPARMAVGEALLAASSHLAGDVDSEVVHLSESLRLFDQAGRPWATPQIRVSLANAMLRRGDPPTAATLLEEAIATATQWPGTTSTSGVAHMLLAQAYRLQGEPELALPNARIGLARLSQAGNALGAAHARADLGLTLAAADRMDEAITMLTDAIAQLADMAGDDAAARSRVTLGQVLRQTGDARGAAQQFALAADAFRTGPDQQAYLFSSAQAALSLAQAGMWDEACQAYDHSLGLATTLGQWRYLIGMHRELAQMAVRDGHADGPNRALHHIGQALAAGEQASGADLTRERGITCHEAGRALAHAQRHEEALAWLDRGIADLSADDASLDELAQAVHLAASIEGIELGRTEAARQRLGPVLKRCTRLGRDDPAAALTRLSAQLA